MSIIYENNEVQITIESAGEYDRKINCNGNNLIWISSSEQAEFIKELTELLDKYRI